MIQQTQDNTISIYTYTSIQKIRTRVGTIVDAVHINSSFMHIAKAALNKVVLQDILLRDSKN